MKREQFLGNLEKPKNDFLWGATLQINLDGYMEKPSCVKIRVSTNESLPLDYPRHSYL